ncbi:hypothetical protein SAMN05216223_110266 [Actinacidiphila yanglinensis]|uniref:Uncharacterized protein n=1 Tax=Actinacidiphila yanglinensis TaxID=310779 RepID=A0A1H6CXE7_9ACTN|nr:DUF6397 family protein [Actinacidiphila yanglinensis]SEG77700.1 hypothetical protein SAMN05216223_110266 [Actinacidiphila yanglinensis]
MTLSAARDALGLAYDEFDLAVQIGEVPTVACGSSNWMVGSREVRRLSAEDGHPLPLLDRLRLVGSPEAAKELGVGRERFVRLARAGHIRPVRWYVNRYQALVWMYLARDLPLLAERSPALLRGPLPEGLRAAVADGEDERARGWRSRRVAQLVRDAYDAWDEAAVWSALLGPELVDSAVPDPYERAHLRRLRAVLPPGRPGPTTPERIRAITTADHPDEIGLGLVALADALGRARKLRHAPGPAGPARVGPGPADPHPADVGPARADPVPPDRVGGADDGRPGRRGLLRLLGRGRRSAGAPSGGRERDPSQSSPTSVIRTTARSSSSDAARSTSAEMPQP